MFKKEYLFEIRKVITNNGVYIRQTSKIDSPRVLQDKIPYNTLVAVKYPIVIENSMKHPRIEIIRPVKGWVFLNDLEILDTFEYLRFGRNYEKYLNQQLKAEGKEEFINQKKLMLKDKIKVYVIKSNEKKKEHQLIDLKRFNNELKDTESSNEEIDFNIENLTYDKYQNHFNNIEIPILIYAGASWCGPCITFKPKLKSLVNKIGNIKLYLVDIDEDHELVEELGIERIPIILFLKKAKVVKQIVGNIEDLDNLESTLIKFKDDNYIKSKIGKGLDDNKGSIELSELSDNEVYKNSLKTKNKTTKSKQSHKKN